MRTAGETLDTAVWVMVQVVRLARLRLLSSVDIPGAQHQGEDVTRVGLPGTLKPDAGVITITGS